MPEPTETKDIEPGHVWLRVDIHGVVPFSAGIPAGGISDLVAPIDKAVGDRPEMKADPIRHQAFKDMVAEWLRNPPPDAAEAERFRGTAVAILLWCALNHPRKGKDFTRMLSDSIRKDDTANITVFCDERGVWAFILAERPVDASGLSAVLQPGFGHLDVIEPGSGAPVKLN